MRFNSLLCNFNENFYIYIQIINSDYKFIPVQFFAKNLAEAKISTFHLPGKKTKLILQQTFGYEVINNSFTFGKNLLMEIGFQPYYITDSST